MKKNFIFIFLFGCVIPMTHQIPFTASRDKNFTITSFGAVYPLQIDIDSNVLAIPIPIFILSRRYGLDENVDFGISFSGNVYLDFRSSPGTFGLGFSPFFPFGYTFLFFYTSFSFGNDKLYYGFGGDFIIVNDRVCLFDCPKEYSFSFPRLNAFAGLFLGKGKNKVVPEIGIVFPLVDKSSLVEEYRYYGFLSFYISIAFMSLKK